MAGTSPATTMKESHRQQICNRISFPGQPCAFAGMTTEYSGGSEKFAPQLRAARRTLELDRVAVGIADIERRAVAFGAVALDHLARMHAMRGEMGAQRALVERRDAQAEMIDVARLAAGRRAAHAAEPAVERDEVDERGPGAQLQEAELLLPFLEGAAEHVAIEGASAIEI